VGGIGAPTSRTMQHDCSSCRGCSRCGRCGRCGRCNGLRGRRVAWERRTTVCAKSPVERVRGSAARATLLPRGWCKRERGCRGAGDDLDQRDCRCRCELRGGRGRRRVQPIPTILAELETVRVVPAAAAAVHDVVASSAVRTLSCPTKPGRYPTRPPSATTPRETLSNRCRPGAGATTGRADLALL